MSFIVVTVSEWHCCNIDYHKSNTLDRNKQYISKNKVWSGTIFWKPFAVVRRQFPFPDCFLFRTVRLQRPGISLWLIARPKMDSDLVFTECLSRRILRFTTSPVDLRGVAVLTTVKYKRTKEIFLIFSDQKGGGADLDPPMIWPVAWAGKVIFLHSGYCRRYRTWTQTPVQRSARRPPFNGQPVYNVVHCTTPILRIL